VREQPKEGVLYQTNSINSFCAPHHPMKVFHNVSVAKRLWMLSLLALVTMISTAVGSQQWGQRALATALAKIEDHDARIALALRWRGLVAAGTEDLVAKAVSAEPLLQETMTPRLKNVIAQVSEIQKRATENADSPAEKQALDKVAQARKTMLDVVRAVDEARKSGDGNAAVALLDQRLKPAAAQYLGAMDDFVKVQQDLRDESKAEALLHADRVQQAGWATMALLVVVSVIGVAWMVRSITQPLHEAVQAAEAIAAGNLTVRIEADRDDELGHLMKAIARMSQQLRGIVTEVRQGVESVATASAEIAHGNLDLSARTEQMAGKLQQTSSSMDEVTTTVAQAADTARQANQLASAAAASAGRGGQVVEQVVSSMARISEGSRRIGDIIGTIDGIAFQTNILALNAAVEAARAGEQGRGFAVVAGEVRALAQRSAEAAKEIKGLISTSMDTVDAGSALVAQTGDAMKEIVGNVQRVADLIGDIAAGAGEQREGIGQVNQAVNHLDQVTQQNAALVEQSAAAAHSLQQQAQRLAQAVAVFNVGAQPGGGTAFSSCPEAMAREVVCRARANALASEAVEAA
jgi:methyl-accepting chemotaxis protein